MEFALLTPPTNYGIFHIFLFYFILHNATVQKYIVKVESLFPKKFANTILSQLSRACFAVLVLMNSMMITGIAPRAGEHDHELAMSLQRQDRAGVERDQAWTQFKHNHLGGEAETISE